MVVEVVLEERMVEHWEVRSLVLVPVHLFFCSGWLPKPEHLLGSSF